VISNHGYLIIIILYFYEKGEKEFAIVQNYYCYYIFKFRYSKNRTEFYA